MAEEGIDIAAEQPKLLTDVAVQTADVVITMGCGDECPFFPGKRYEDWVLDDPAGQGIDAVRPIRDEPADDGAVRRDGEVVAASLGAPHLRPRAVDDRDDRPGTIVVDRDDALAHRREPEHTTVAGHCQGRPVGTDQLPVVGGIGRIVRGQIADFRRRAASLSPRAVSLVVVPPEDVSEGDSVGDDDSVGSGVSEVPDGLGDGSASGSVSSAQPATSRAAERTDATAISCFMPLRRGEAPPGCHSSTTSTMQLRTSSSGSRWPT